MFIAAGSEVFDVTEPPNVVKPYRMVDFRNTMAPFQFPVVNDKGKVTMHEFSEAWRTSKQRQTVRGTVFEPGKERITDISGIPMLNTYFIAPFKMTEERDLFDEFMKIVDRTHPIPKEREIFLDWLAFSFRYPQQKVLWAYTNISEARGSGRGLLANAVSNLLGHNNVKPVKLKDISGAFDDYAYQSLVTVIEEGDADESGKRVKVDGHWNDIITSQRSMLNLKYAGQVNANLYNNFMIFLNHYSLIIDKADRRIQAVTGAPKEIPPLAAEWVSKYSNMFAHDKDFRDQLASFLWVRDLSDFDYGHCDRSLPARQKLLDASESPADQLAADILEHLPSRVIHAKGLLRLVELACANQKLADVRVVYNQVRGKATKQGHRVNVKGDTYVCYVYGGLEEGYAAELELSLKKLSGINI